MKKLYILLFAILISAVSFGQTVFINEIHYDNGPEGDINEGVEIAGPAGTDLSTYTITLYNGSGGAVYNTLALSGTIPNEGSSGYGTVWFGYASNGLQNGAPDGIALSNSGALIQFLSYEGSFAGVGGIADSVMSTDIGISETNTTPLDQSLQLTGTGFNYTNFSWTGPVTHSRGLLNAGQTFGTPVPSLALSDGPANGSNTVEDPEIVNNAEIDFATTNFTMSNDAGGGVSDGSGDGYIIWSVENTNGSVFVDGGNVFTSNDPLTTYPVSGLATGETYFFRAELVDNNGDPLSSPVVFSFTITFATYNDVPDLATLRASTVDPDTYYRITGEVINTFSRSSNNQKYFQDTTGGILVHDPDFEISTAYNEGDGVTNLRGHLELFNGLLEFIPTEADWGAPSSTGNVITPEVVTIATVIAGLDTYESKLVRLNNVTFADGNGITTFSSSSNYVINDGTASTFRTTFFEADYIGQLIPQGSINIVVLVGNFNGSAQFTARSMAELTLSTKDSQIEGFRFSPNPTSLGYINISSKSQTAMNVGVYDILGKQVINKTVSNNRLDVSTLTSGIYVMKISQDNATTTKKLVIK